MQQHITRVMFWIVYVALSFMQTTNLVEFCFIFKKIKGSRTPGA